MSDQQQEHPTLAQSKSGQNRYLFPCEALQQTMLYCSCQARLGALDKPDVKVPKDWQECGRHRVHGECKAAKMQTEERQAGHALYFVAPGAKLVPTLDIPWHKGEDKNLPKPIGRSKPAPAPKPQSMLDVIGKSNDLAAVVNTVAKQVAPLPVSEPPKSAPVPMPSIVPPSIVVTKPQAAPPQLLKAQTDGIHPVLAKPIVARPPMNPGESPLAYARRLRELNTTS